MHAIKERRKEQGEREREGEGKEDLEGETESDSSSNVDTLKFSEHCLDCFLNPQQQISKRNKRSWVTNN